jgi:hypothetical protein
MYDWLGPVLTYNIFPSIDSMSTNTSAKFFGKSAVNRKIHLQLIEKSTLFSITVLFFADTV